MCITEITRPIGKEYLDIKKKKKFSYLNDKQRKLLKKRAKEGKKYG